MLVGYLKQQHITQKKVAQVIRRSEATTSNKISGKSDFTRAEIQILHDQLKIPFSAFFGS